MQFKSSRIKIDTGITKPTLSYKNMLECNWRIHPTGFTIAFHYMKSNILDTEIKDQLVTLKLDNQMTLNRQSTVLKYCYIITWII